MTSRTTHLRFGMAMVALPSIATAWVCACANEGVDHAPADPDAAVEAAVEPIDAPSEAGEDAGRCSASKLCIVPIPVDRRTRFADLWGFGASNVWAVGNAGTILHYDGTTWEKAGTGGPSGGRGFTLRSVWLGGPEDVWIADGESIWHGTGWQNAQPIGWSSVTPTPGGPAPTAIRGSPDTLFLGSSPRNGSGLSIQGTLATSARTTDGGLAAVQIYSNYFLRFNAIAVSGPDEAWAVGDLFGADGYALRISRSLDDGGAAIWHVEEVDYKSSTRRPMSVWGDDSAVWIVGDKGMLRRITRSAMPTKAFEVIESPVDADLHDVFGFGPDDVWAVGDGSTVLHWDGAAWTRLSTPFDGAPASERPTFEAIWGASPEDLWVSGDGTMLHFEGVRP